MDIKFNRHRKGLGKFVTWSHALELVRAGLAGILLSAILGGLAQPVRLPSADEAPFTRVTNGPVITEIEYSWPCAWGDYDNDGFLDLFVGNSYQAANSLFHN